MALKNRVARKLKVHVTTRGLPNTFGATKAHHRGDGRIPCAINNNAVPFSVWQRTHTVTSEAVFLLGSLILCQD